MLLSQAAELADNLRHWYKVSRIQQYAANDALWQMAESVKSLTVEHSNDMDLVMDFFYPKHSRYPERFTSLQHVRENVCRELAISPVVWDEVLGGKAVVPALAEESHPNKTEGMRLKDAMALLHDIESKSILKTCAKMNETEGRLFWSRALGENPPVPVHRFLQCISYVGGEPRSVRYIRRLLVTMTPIEVFHLLRMADPRLEMMEKKLQQIQPGVPFIGPYYPAWTKATVPSGVYLDIIKGQRRYLHITEFPKGEWRGILYTRDRKPVSRITEHNLPITGKEYVFEVEVDGHEIKRITDILSVGEDWEFYKQSYSQRLAHAGLLSLAVPVTDPFILEEGSDIGHVLSRTQEDERVRLIDGGAFQMGGEGGWTIMKNAFHLHLMLSSVRRDQHYNIRASLSVMDGFEPIEVHNTVLRDGQAYQLRERLAKEGIMVSNKHIDTDEFAVIFLAEVRGVDVEQMTLTDIELVHIDDNLGISDVSQLTDLMELGL